MNRFSTASIAVLALLAPLLTACGSEGDAPDSAQAAAEPPPPAGPPARDSMSAASLVGIAPEEISLALPWSVGRMNRGADALQANRTIDQVLLLSGEGFDRFVVTFRDDGPDFPGYTVEFQDGPAQDCAASPSESSFDSQGEAYLSITVNRVLGHEDDGTNTSGPRRIPGGSEHVSAAHKTCDFEGQAQWVFDLSAPHPYRILELHSPDRLVVDIQHPFTPIPEPDSTTGGA